MKTVLVTGAAGFIGGHVKHALATRACRVRAIEHGWANAAELSALLGQEPLDSCIHLGWYAKPEDYLHNADGNIASLSASLDLVRALLDRGCEHLTVAGTCAEYGDPEGPVEESAAIAPTTMYAAAKTSFRLLLESSWLDGAMTVAWARIFSVSGPGEDSARVLPQVARTLLTGRPIAVSDGNQTRDFLAVDDVSEALVEMALRRLEGVFNVSSGRAVQLKDLFLQIAEKIGVPSGNVLIGARPSDPGTPRFLVGRNEKLRSSSAWSPKVDLDALLEDMIRYWRAQPPL